MKEGTLRKSNNDSKWVIGFVENNKAYEVSVHLPTYKEEYPTILEIGKKVMFEIMNLPSKEDSSKFVSYARIDRKNPEEHAADEFFNNSLNNGYTELAPNGITIYEAFLAGVKWQKKNS